MRYFHRTSLAPVAVLAEAERFLGSRLSAGGRAERHLVFSGAIGRVSVHVKAEGGHYTLVTVETDQVGESELDRLAKRLLAVVHQQVEPGHELRGAY